MISIFVKVPAMTTDFVVFNEWIRQIFDGLGQDPKDFSGLSDWTGECGSANSQQNYMLLVQNWCKILLFPGNTTPLLAPKGALYLITPGDSYPISNSTIVKLHFCRPAKVNPGTYFKDLIITKRLISSLSTAIKGLKESSSSRSSTPSISITKRWSDREQRAPPQSLESASAYLAFLLFSTFPHHTNHFNSAHY